jgi:restriction system protein
VQNYVQQLWAFRHGIAVGDLVVLPCKTTRQVAIGRVTGEYQYLPDLPRTARHLRMVEWHATDLPRDAIGRDLRNSLGVGMTVCEVTRNRGAERLAALAESGADPGA